MHPAHALDEVRRAAGFRTVDEVAALAPSVLVLDPASTLIGTGVSIERGVLVFPGTTLETRSGGTIAIRTGARLGPGPVTIVAEGPHVEVGRAELGPGAVTVVAAHAPVTVGDGARLSGGCVVEGPATIGAGAQVLGTVALRSVELGAGGGRREPDPDRRGAVVKGAGRVHGIQLGQGEVVVGRTEVSAPERQRAHHPDVTPT